MNYYNPMDEFHDSHSSDIFVKDLLLEIYVNPAREKYFLIDDERYELWDNENMFHI
jgi:hypothetical protein